jgi:Abnormal spindle-like microcephaly-assoc'd, ASPM-SPD-2-Hydin
MCTSPKLSRRNPFLSLMLPAALVTLVLTNLTGAQTASQLVCSPCSINFGNVAVGGSQAVPVSFSNPGTSPITISGETKSGPWFFFRRGLPLPYTIHPGQTVTFNIVFAPTSDRTSNETFTYQSNASNSSLTLSMSGTGVAAGTMTATPLSLGFGWVPVGAVSMKTLTISNPGQSSLTISQVSDSGGVLASPFTTSGVTTPLTLAAGQSFTFQVTFAPKNVGDFFGNLSVVSSTGAQISVAENGVGSSAGVLSVSPSSVNFGSVTVGSSQSQTITLSAPTNQVTVTSDSLGSSEYSISGLSLPLTLPAGQSATVTITFAPQSSGAANTSLAFATSSGTASPVVTSLVGTGVTATPHSVALSWQPSSTSDVAGYNVYRGTQSSGPYSKINASSDGSTSFSDESVQAGNSYYYEVTSVDSSGMESSPTSPVEASVPSS